MTTRSYSGRSKPAASSFRFTSRSTIADAASSCGLLRTSRSHRPCGMPATSQNRSHSRVGRRALGRHRDQGEVVAADLGGPALGDRRRAAGASRSCGRRAVLVVADGLEELLPLLHAAVLHRLGPHRGQRAGQVARGQHDLEVGAGEGLLDDRDLVAARAGRGTPSRRSAVPGQALMSVDQPLPGAVGRPAGGCSSPPWPISSRTASTCWRQRLPANRTSCSARRRGSGAARSG